MKKNYDTPTIHNVAVVPGHPSYLIYDDARVFSIKSAKFLKPIDNGDGHMKVYLEGEKFFIHRLVAEAFIPNPDGFENVHHLDGNPSNNRVENLEWVSHAEHQRIHCSKQVMRVDNGQIYRSAREASRALGLHENAVSMAIFRNRPVDGTYWCLVEPDFEIFED